MKTIRIISVAAAAAMFMACAKENIITPSSQELCPLTFNAVAAGSVSDDATKTVLAENGLDVLWTAGDAISVCGAASAFTSDLAEGSSAETSFSGEALAADVYYAVYPYSAVKTWTGSTVTLELPADQVPALNTFADGLSICYASTSAEDMAFRFEHLLGYVKFTIDENSGAVTTVNIATNGNEPLAGSFTVDLSSETPSASASGSMSHIVMESETPLAPGNYYIAMLPGTYSQGLTISFLGENGGSDVKSVNTSLTLEAGKIQNIGTVARLDGISTDVNERVIWTGSWVCGTWGGNQDLAWDGFDWNDVELPAALVIEVEQDASFDYWQLSLRHATEWGNIPEFTDINMTQGQTEVKIEIYPEMLADIQANNGLVFTGCNYTLKKVTLITESVYVSEHEVWSGTTDLGTDWQPYVNLSGDANVFQNITDGCTLHVDYATNSDDTYSQLQLNRSDWTTGLTSVDDANEYGTIDLTAGAGTKSYVLDDADVSALRSSGMIIKGYNVTVTRVYWTE